MANFRGNYDGVGSGGELTASQEALISQLENYGNIRAYKNADQTVSSGAITQIDFDVEAFDRQGEFNLGNDTFTAATSGIYLIVANIGFNAMNIGDTMEVYIYSGETPSAKARMTAGANGTGNHTIGVSTILSLDADDTVSIRAQHNHGTARNILGTEVDSNLSICKLYTGS